MNINIASDWKTVLKSELKKPYFSELANFVKEETKNHQIYPQEKHIFNAFEHCNYKNVKVVILGQDPYHGKGQANGLCFSVSDAIKIPPSLANIFKEIQSDLGKEIPKSGNLERWANQGILLLNATLTVRASDAGSHQKKGWEQFTDAVIQNISEQKENIVFILWGAYAQKKGSLIDQSKHHILKSAHPSPFSVYRGFLGNKHFSQTNDYLQKIGKQEIDW